MIMHGKPPIAVSAAFTYHHAAMSLDSKQIEICVLKGDVPGLRKFVELARAQGQNGIAIAHTAIWNVLTEWQNDFSCNKGGDPNDYPYLEGLSALEALGVAPYQLSDSDRYATLNVTHERGIYYSICSNYCKNAGDLPKARKTANEAEVVFRQALLEGSVRERAYFHLIHLFETYPAVSLDEAAGKLVEALDLMDDAFRELPKLSIEHFISKTMLFYGRHLTDGIYNHPRVRDRFTQE
jgi:hypothetical protein